MCTSAEAMFFKHKSQKNKVCSKWTTMWLAKECKRSHSRSRHVNHTFLLIVVICLVYLSQSEACSCIYSHPQEHYCSADFVTLVNVRKAQKSDQSVIAYQIKIKKEFKMTVKAREALSNGLIWTSEDESLCGRKLQLNTRYLITGRLVGSKPWVSVCNFVEPWSALTYKQKKGFRRLYAFGCRCKVREPPSSTYFAYKHVQLQSQSPHRLAARPGYCHWETKWENKYDCQGLHSICTPVSIQAKRKQSSDANVKNAKSIVKAGAAKLKDHKSASIHLHECQWVQSEAYKECMRKREENRVDIDRQEP